MTSLVLALCIFASFFNASNDNETSVGSASGASLADFLLKVPAKWNVEPQAGKADLQYIAPRGWAQTEVNGERTLKKFNEDHKVFNLVVLPTRPLNGSLRDTFAQLWNMYIGSEFATTIAPLPMMTRLKSGYACAFDVDDGAKFKNGVHFRAALYLIAQGGMVTPVVGMFAIYDTKVEGELEGFFESARIPGASTAKVKLFAASDIAGDWARSSSSFADYVTSTGAYAGDASIAVAQSFDLSATGSYKHIQVVLAQGRRFSDTDAGAWSLDDNDLVLKHNPTERYVVFGYGSAPKLGRFLVLSDYSDRINGATGSKIEFSRPRSSPGTEWFHAK